MAYGSGTMKPPVKKKGTMTQRLNNHSQKHSKKHMASMRRDIKAGMSFTAAHKKAQKSVGK